MAHAGMKPASQLWNLPIVVFEVESELTVEVGEAVAVVALV